MGGKISAKIGGNCSNYSILVTLFGIRGKKNSKAIPSKKETKSHLKFEKNVLKARTIFRTIRSLV